MKLTLWVREFRGDIQPKFTIGEEVYTPDLDGERVLFSVTEETDDLQIVSILKQKAREEAVRRGIQLSDGAFK